MISANDPSHGLPKRIVKWRGQTWVFLGDKHEGAMYEFETDKVPYAFLSKDGWLRRNGSDEVIGDRQEIDFDYQDA